MTATAALPPRLRHRLAETIVAALHEARARHELAALGSDESFVRDWCGADAGAHGDLVGSRARQAAKALGALPLRPASPDLQDVLEAAAILFDAALFFEAHELLEPHWQRARGEARQALQGLIQIAVGYQHWVHGNHRGAESLLEEGSVRVRGRRVAGLGLDAFADAVARSRTRLDQAMPVSPPFPRRARRTRRP